MRCSALIVVYAAGLAMLAGGCTTDDSGDGTEVRPGGGDGGGKGGTGAGPGGTGGTAGIGIIDAPIGDDGGGGGKCLGAGGKALGNACGCNAECASGFCADGVCCNTACSGACVSCSAAETKGECTVIAQGGADPHGICKKEAPQTCGQDGTCNGLGGCAKHKSGTSCGAATCSGGGLVPASSCDGNGVCLAGSPITCNPSICVGGACKVVCDTNADCVAGRVCTAHSCGPRPLGVPCENNGQCKSGFCADGVCCDNACTGKCSYCGLPTSLGRCVPVGANAPDPRAAAGVKDAARICVDQGAAACGTTGRCDGSGGCQIYADGTVCKNQSCNDTNNRATPTSTCKAGVCTTAAARSCGAFKCAGPRCGTSCTGNNDCVAPNTCIDGLCGRLPLGAPCSRDNVCGSGFCTGGVCCNSRCNGVCQQCNEASSMGICSPVAAGGVDPSSTCKDAGPQSCGSDGTCNGKGACRQYAAGTKCADARCTNGSVTDIGTCNGTGMCRTPPARSCGGFACDPGGPRCLASCQADNQCVGVPCVGGKCGQSSAGGPCQDGNDCRTGLLCSKNSVCCNTACAGPCESCASGTCSPLGAGSAPPGGGCPRDPTNPTCGNTGSCDGSGKCALGAPAGASCGGDCNGDSRVPSTCVNARCTAGAPMSCSPQVCRGPGMCTPCTADGDCPSGRVCAGGTCQAPRDCMGPATRACGNCGTQTRACNQATGMFGDFGPCMNEGVCAPGMTRPCPTGGTQTCSNSCSWGMCNCTPMTACPSGQNCGEAPDGCMGTIRCGTCGTAQRCDTAASPPHCVCAPATTCPAGQTCGTAPDGCSGTINCGTCGTGEKCDTNATPPQCVCAPRTTCPAGQTCGSVPDGCTGTINCGSCGAGEKCAGTPPQCVCAPRTTCPAGQTCGTAPDGCNGTIDCGNCKAGETCDNTPAPPHCVAVCVPKSCADLGVECGTADDGCGHTLTCGNGGDCPAGQMCTNAKKCVACACAQDDCGTKTLCGASRDCGSCPGNQVCDGNQKCCKPKTACAAGRCAGTEPDGCGGQVTCTEACAMGQTCDPDGRCVP
jgi:hypothetical protein